MKTNLLANKIFVTCFALFLISSVSALPGLPHQFYGSVRVNGVSAPDNNIITGVIEGDEYLTITKGGKYGSNPNSFFIEDPDGDREGKQINFLMDGLQVGSSVFANNGYTKLDFSATTTCGDSYCIGSETCGSCSNDCGICTTPPAITIISPENKIYDTVKINLDVSADQPIILWLYSLNSQTPATFIPNITITAQEGPNNLTVIGISNTFQSGQSSVSFNVDLPDDFCGNTVCGAAESCSTCSSDCGQCSSSSSSSSSGGGGGGGGGGGAKPKTNATNNAAVNLNLENLRTGNDESAFNNEELIEENQEGSSGITGAVTGLINGIRNKIVLLIGIIFVVGTAILAVVYRKKKK